MCRLTPQSLIRSSCHCLPPLICFRGFELVAQHSLYLFIAPLFVFCAGDTFLSSLLTFCFIFLRESLFHLDFTLSNSCLLPLCPLASFYSRWAAKPANLVYSHFCPYPYPLPYVISYFCGVTTDRFQPSHSSTLGTLRSLPYLHISLWSDIPTLR
ncbi:hypothetical protein F5B18DRAFT_598506 [Nemania serpens]|nr:hypothetical protein F5B18DRAFT_598506 [Nemania serpens]